MVQTNSKTLAPVLMYFNIVFQVPSAILYSSLVPVIANTT